MSTRPAPIIDWYDRQESMRCPSCGRDMDKGEPHTATCPSALRQDAEEGGR